MEPDEPLLATAQACRELGMSWHTYKAWCARLGIELGVKHPFDERLRMVPRSTIERIREARASLPSRSPAKPPVDLLSASQTPSRPSVPTRSIERIYTIEGLPDDWVRLSAFAERHNVNQRTVDSQREAGRFTGHQIPPGERGEWYLDPDGQRAAVEWWFLHYKPKPGTPRPHPCTAATCPCQTLVPGGHPSTSLPLAAPASRQPTVRHVRAH